MFIPAVIGDIGTREIGDATETIAGCAFDVAWHLAGFDCKPALIGRVGRDRPADLITERLVEWGIDHQGLQYDNHRATQRISARRPQPPCGAARCVRFRAARTVLETVAPRVTYWAPTMFATPINRSTSRRLIGTPIDGWRFCHFDATTSLADATVTAALSDADIVLADAINLASWTGEAKDTSSLRSLKASTKRVRQQWGLPLLIVRGPNGGHVLSTEYETWVTRSTRRDRNPHGVSEAVAAIVLLGVCEAWPIEVLAARAQGFADMIAAQSLELAAAGAVYQTAREQWRRASPERSGDEVKPIAPLPKRRAEATVAEHERQRAAQKLGAIASTQAPPAVETLKKAKVAARALRRAEKNVRRVGQSRRKPVP